jgi:hypothetical protein
VFGPLITAGNHPTGDQSGTGDRLGLLLGFVPHIPEITLDPELVFLVILPPLLYSAAWLTSWQEFCHNLVSIASLAIGLVAFTVLGVAAASWLTGFDWRIGFVLGAVVATTDAMLRHQSRNVSGCRSALWTCSKARVWSMTQRVCSPSNSP